MLYIIIAILAVIIFFSVYNSKKVRETDQLVPNKIKTEAEQLQVITQSTEPVEFFKDAITLIKSAPKIETAVPGVIKKDEINYASNDVSVVGMTSSSSSGGYSSSEEGEESAAGITRTGKYPSNESVREMNSKGIVMY